MDWYSRYVLSWAVSTTMDTSFCHEALAQALQQATPEIFNSDQGSQFTSHEFTDCLKNAGIAISMDGRGRVFDNILIERMWRSVKWEHIYLYDYEDVMTLKQGLQKFFLTYNTKRPHQGLGYTTPAERYFGTGAELKP
jgi:putative transposase